MLKKFHQDRLITHGVIYVSFASWPAGLGGRVAQELCTKMPVTPSSRVNLGFDPEQIANKGFPLG